MLFRRRGLEKLIQPIEDDLAHQAAILGQAVTRGSFIYPGDNQFFLGIWQRFDKLLLLLFGFLIGIVACTDQVQDRTGNLGRIKPVISALLHHAFKVGRVQAPTPGHRRGHDRLKAGQWLISS
jgi:hypothetical protein